VFKVAGKMFALSQLAEHPLRVSLKCEPQLAEQLRAHHCCILGSCVGSAYIEGQP
jgi:predicted DNA-binding protein (MmcQ/YjbR family)